MLIEILHKIKKNFEKQGSGIDINLNCRNFSFIRNFLEMLKNQNEKINVIILT